MFKGFLVHLAYFTRVPIGKFIEYDEVDFIKGLGVYSLTGVIIGIFLMLGYLIGNFLQIFLINGLIITIFYIIITGAIHIDGLSDSSDGLFSGRTGDRIFEIMSDSRVGAFGVISIVMLLSSQIILFSHINIYEVLLVPVVGKTAVIVSCYNSNYAKANKGMGTIFVESISDKELFMNLACLAFVCLILPGKIVNFIAIFLTLISTFFISKSIKKVISGMTGDTCGFVAEISQILFMFFILFSERLLYL